MTRAILTLIDNCHECPHMCWSIPDADGNCWPKCSAPNVVPPGMRVDYSDPRANEKWSPPILPVRTPTGRTYDLTIPAWCPLEEVQDTSQLEKLVEWIRAEGLDEAEHTHYAGPPAMEEEPTPVFDEDNSFMMGGELAFFTVVENGVKLYSNAIEPWGVFIAIADPAVDDVEMKARAILREQRPEWFEEGEDDV